MTDYMTPYQKVQGNHYSPVHMRALANYLCANILNRYDTILDSAFRPDYASAYKDHDLAPFIVLNWNENDVRKANDAVRATYNKSNKRGRPFGSKNRPKTDADALEILGDLKNADDELLDIQDEINKANTRETAPKIENSEDVKKQIAKLFEEFLNRYEQDHNEHGEFLSDSFRAMETMVNDKFKVLAPNIVHVKPVDMPIIDMGIQHRNFETLLKMCCAKTADNNRLNIWVYGPAGTGKSKAAQNVAKALNLKFYADGKLGDKTELLGFKDAMSNYKPTNFRLAFEFGGVYLGDEIDGWMPDANLALNGALANGLCAFPDAIIERHPDFVMIAAANTTGNSGTVEYVGRFKQDAAFTDRFSYLDWPIDEALEDAIIGNKDWLRLVRKVRYNISKSTIKGHLITPRASIYGQSLLAAGLPLEFVINSVLKKGLNETQWNMIQ